MFSFELSSAIDLSYYIFMSVLRFSVDRCLKRKYEILEQCHSQPMPKPMQGPLMNIDGFFFLIKWTLMVRTQNMGSLQSAVLMVVGFFAF